MRTLIVLVALAACAFAPLPPRKDPLKVLEGTWELTAVEWVGSKKGPSDTIALVRIKGRQWTTVFKRPPATKKKQEASATYDITLDPAARNPFHLDLKPQKDGATLVGLLEVKKDAFTFGYTFDRDGGKAQRPAGLDKMARGDIVMTFKRMN